MTQLADPPAGPDETLTKAASKGDVALGAQPLTMVQALNRALHDAMAADDRVLVFGEDVSVEGGVFRVTEGLAETFGEERCFDTPLAASAIIGIAVGLALRGFVPVPEIQFDGFSNPAVAYWLLRHAIVCPDPVMYLEPKRRYQGRGLVDASRPEPPIGQAMVRRPGTDVTVVTYGSLVSTAVATAEEAQRQRGWSLDVIDLRSLVPLDFDTIAASIHRTGRCVVLHEGPRSLGYGAGLAARIQEEMFYELEAPVLRACGFDTPYPPARLERLWLPGPDRLLDCVERALELP